jgi:hypothetical protein
MVCDSRQGFTYDLYLQKTPSLRESFPSETLPLSARLRFFLEYHLDFETWLMSLQWMLAGCWILEKQ